MRQNIGLLFLTIGSVLLSIRIFLDKVIGNWDDLTIEQRFFYRLIGRKTLWDKSQKKDNLISKFGDPKYRKKLIRSARLREDIPIIAAILIIAGFFLALDYASIARIFC